MQGKTLLEWIRKSPDVLKKGKAFLNGQEIEFGVPDGGLVRKKILEHNATGAKVLKDFETWMIENEGLDQDRAIKYRKYVWNVLCLTWNNALQRSEPEVFPTASSYAYSTILVIVAALKRWAIFAEDGVLLGEVVRIERAHRKTPKYMVGDEPSTDSTIYSDDVMDKLHDALSTIRGDPRYPWGWPTLSLEIKTGLRISTELLTITKDRAHQAIQTGSLKTWSKTGGTKIVSAAIVGEELQTLDEIDLRWERLSDLIAPTSKPDQRVVRSSFKVTDLAEDVYNRAGIPFGRGWVAKIRKTAAVRLWRETNDLMVLSQFTGATSLTAVRAILGDHIFDK